MIRFVPKEKADTKPSRRRTIPLWGAQYDWWPDAVRSTIKELGIDQKWLAEWIGAHPAEVNKCITRKTPVYELLLDISDALDLPYPVVLPESFDEALKVAKERRLARRDAQVDQIKAGVGAGRRAGQIRAISLADVANWKPGKDEAKKHRAQPRATR